MCAVPSVGSPMVKNTTRFRTMLEGPGPTLVPGVYDGLSAALAEDVGFEAIALTGAGVSVTHGYPDLGLLTLTEVVERARAILRASSLPVMADADTGYGGVLNIQRAVQEFESAGIAALHIEDQVSEKRCGLFSGIEVVETEEMAARLTAALEARSDPDLCVIARTDMRACGTLTETIDRANAYREAGADAIFLFDLHSREELEIAGREIPGPKMTHVSRGAKIPPMAPDELAGLGYGVIFYPLTPLQAASKALREALEHIRDDASLEPLYERMTQPAELYDLVGVHGLEDFASRHEPKRVRSV